ncbi:hypothetical protein LDENG_00283130 [Lucifuga dentata]|nr:hypothetical protein LDENG_00283130 [Lucifuga dentata]
MKLKFSRFIAQDPKTCSVTCEVIWMSHSRRLCSSIRSASRGLMAGCSTRHKVRLILNMHALNRHRTSV